ncbi:cobyrinic acid a,c-diamide synthase [Xenococcus sp. PCC 7305]|uniref:cobyrinate a,c-diamide synthase n=1 Tax=Xenococcus sp. PCC 7305 TaxID=102125 RepID=UPI0002ABE055|nr:cobyrinate a,c-diamide synthase [Xenococcus sp. PCC 7305]ELS02989.1 cobyrinic acid a,c-diamide synthase [Xenococcus sp. PCC 7305]
MSLIIAGGRSGVGKTTITLALLAFLSQQKKTIQSFKVGPDYIDPMFHQALTGVAARNLDPVLTSPEYVKSCFGRYSQGSEYILIEGVMGLFDGIEFPLSRIQDCDSRPIGNYASTAYISRLLNIPVLLVLDCASLSGSIAAIAYGYANLDPQLQIAGLVLNRVGSDRHLELLENALRPLNIPIVGVLRRVDKITIPDRHLGLIPTAELPQLAAIFDHLAHIGKTCFDWEKLLPLLKKSQVISNPLPITHYPLPITHYPLPIKNRDRPRSRF